MSHQDEGRNGGPEFPCATLDAALSHLRRPPSAAAVRFKVQATSNNAAQVAPYVDARLVFDRLDLVAGGRWSACFEALPERLIPPAVDRNGEVTRPQLYVRCRLSVLGVTREDVGEGEDPKAAFSDAIKRAAVHFGIGRALYALGAPWLREGDEDGQLRRNRRERFVIDKRTERWLRLQYERWLEAKGLAMFGEPLDHGDEADAPEFEAERRDEAAPQDGQRGGAEPEPGAGTGISSGEGAGAASLRSRKDAGADGERPASDSQQGGSEAPESLERAQVEHWRRTGRYRAETVARIAGLLCGSEDLDALDDSLRSVAQVLEFAVRGNVPSGELAALVDRLVKLPDRELSQRSLREWVARKANEAELTARRAA